MLDWLKCSFNFCFPTPLKPKPLLFWLLFCPPNWTSKLSLPWVNLAKVEVKSSTHFLRSSFSVFISSTIWIVTPYSFHCSLMIMILPFALKKWTIYFDVSFLIAFETSWKFLAWIFFILVFLEIWQSCLFISSLGSFRIFLWLVQYSPHFLYHHHHHHY